MKGLDIRAAFVSTNSIAQGEQVSALWRPLFQKYAVKIHFAHRTFRWISEAKGKAHVHVVIIGFGTTDVPWKCIWEYEEDGNHGSANEVANISPYLIEGPDVCVTPRSKPICGAPACIYGNKPADGGHLIIEDRELAAFLAQNPQIKPFIRPLLCAEEYLHGVNRWCLWLVDAPPQVIRACPGVLERVKAVRDFRLASKKGPTREKSTEPSLFAEVRQPTSRYIVIPQHTSENRKYVPFGYFKPRVVIHNSCSAVPKASPYHFGVLSSAMHMAWVRQVCGRIKSDFRYSNKLVYNTFPWPQAATDGQKARVEECAQAVLDARAKFPDATLADLYDPVSMPPALARAHAKLDAAVDRCYRAQPFTTDRQRFEFLVALYERLTAPLTAPAEPKRRRK
jgi:hypothetical protein